MDFRSPSLARLCQPQHMSLMLTLNETRLTMNDYIVALPLDKYGLTSAFVSKVNVNLNEFNR